MYCVLLLAYDIPFQLVQEQKTSTGWSTPTTRGWSWRRSSTTAGTSPSGEKLSSQMESASQRDRWDWKDYILLAFADHKMCRWKSGFKTAEQKSEGAWRSRTTWCWRTNWTHRAWERFRHRWARWTTSPPPLWGSGWDFPTAFPNPITFPRACMALNTLGWWNLSEEKTNELTLFLGPTVRDMWKQRLNILALLLTDYQL